MKTMLLLLLLLGMFNTVLLGRLVVAEPVDPVPVVQRLVL